MHAKRKGCWIARFGTTCHSHTSGFPPRIRWLQIRALLASTAIQPALYMHLIATFRCCADPHSRTYVPEQDLKSLCLVICEQAPSDGFLYIRSKTRVVLQGLRTRFGQRG